jgi:HNH endonuclease
MIVKFKECRFEGQPDIKLLRVPVYSKVKRNSITNKLNKDKLVGYAFIDDNEFSRNVLVKYKYYYRKGYAIVSLKGGIRKDLHQLVVEHFYGKCPEGKCIDHIDRDPLNDFISNLRIVSYSVNAKNSKMHTNNTSGYKGVSLDIRWNKWTARMKAHGKYISLGAYRDKDDAGRAVNIAHVKHYPEIPIPNPNIPDPLRPPKKDRCSVNKTGYLGVYPSSKKNSTRWYASLKIKRKLYYIGSYATEKEAAMAVDEFFHQHFLDKPLPNGVKI